MTAKEVLGVLQEYVDERARRWAVTAERSDEGGGKDIAHALMHECLKIGRKVAQLRRT